MPQTVPFKTKAEIFRSVEEVRDAYLPHAVSSLNDAELADAMNTGSALASQMMRDLARDVSRNLKSK